MKYKIYIVEDDSTLARVLSEHIKSLGYEAFTVQNFSNILKEVEEIRPHLILMDITLPHFNGYYWCNEIRKKSKVPVVFISSASDDMNIIMAMDMGGDDFLKKPFHLDVVGAKLRAILRRAYDFKDEIESIFACGVDLNLLDMTISMGDDKMELSKNEFKILKLLMENKGRVVSREKIMIKLWEADMYVEENTLTVNINRLRKKLSSIGKDDLIHTKVGAGYIIKD